MSHLYLEVYSLCGNVAQVPVNTAICLFNLMYLETPKNINLNFILTKPLENFLNVDTSCLQYKLLSEKELESFMLNCCFPIFVPTDKSCCIAGLCAVLRQVIKHSEKKWKHLLGFREACLFACAEVSLWTKYCEVDVVVTAQELLSDQSSCISIPRIPENIVRFEEHLGQPVRVHNIGKIIEKNQENIIEHRFAEGWKLSLADVIIFPCLRIFIQLLGSDELSRYIPLTLQWYKRMCDQQNILNSLNIIYDLKNKLSSPLNITYIIPTVPKQSLYKSDPKRYRPRSKIFTRQEDVESVLSIVEGLETSINYDSKPFGFEVTFNWNDTPEDIKPDVPKSRLDRKCQQLENLCKAVIKIAKIGDIIVDFCCGSGHLGILLAYYLPHCQIILLDNKEESLARGIRKVKQLGLNNVSLIQCNLNYFKGHFQIGVSLHACGTASDLVLHCCLLQNAAFVVCPCCYGSLQNNHILSYPRSQTLKESLLDTHSYFVLGHCADQTHKNIYSKSEQGEKCMAIVDIDRCLKAKEEGYKICLAKLIPSTCSPKNNLLVGIPGF